MLFTKQLTNLVKEIEEALRIEVCRVQQPASLLIVSERRIII